MTLSEHPVTTAALQNGCVDSYKAQLIVTELDRMCGRTSVPALEVSAVEYGRTHTGTQLRAWLRRQILRANPAATEQARQGAFKDRSLIVFPGQDGMAVLPATMPAEIAVGIRRFCDQVAHAGRYAVDKDGNMIRPGSAGDVEGRCDDRSMDAKRLDAFLDLWFGRLTSIGIGTGIGEIQVSVSAEALAGLSEEPGQLAGYGPISAEHARQLAQGDVRWRRLIYDPIDGRLIELGQKTYRPGNQLARGIQARDLVCRFPSCNRAATGAGIDLDHTTPWPAGRTDADNLMVLCRHHHRLKHDPDWKVEHLPGNVLRWTSSSGRVFYSYPHNYRPDEQEPGAPPGCAA